MTSRIEEMLKTAKENGASDVHMTVGIPPKMRVNGKLVTMDYPTLTAENTMEAVMHILNEQQRKRFEAAGECDLSYAIAGEGRFRVNVYRQRGSATLAFRLVNTQIPKPETLGLSQAVIDLYKKKRGLVLVTGPTGSGKSTTLASLIDTINTNREAHIITLEDPIEYLHRHNQSIVNQREIGIDTQSYASALRAALREDPDVILVGEMRDYETISVAITAAETGHFVLSTLHTMDAASTVDRVIDVFPEHQQQQIRVQFANVLEAIISQQLLPTVDEKRRVAAFEILLANAAVRNLIREGKTHQLVNVMQTNRKAGMLTMDDAIGNLYHNFEISKEIALQYANDEESIKNKLM